jgi:hypothetical protein
VRRSLIFALACLIFAVCAAAGGCSASVTIGPPTPTANPEPASSTAAADGWAAVTCGTYDTVALRRNGTLWAWGTNYGMLGLGDPKNRYTPTQVGHDHDWKAVYQGSGYTLAVKRDDSLWAWGGCPVWAPDDPAMVNGAVKDTPTEIGNAAHWASVACGARIWIIKSDGTLWAWGGRTAAGRKPIQISVARVWKAVFDGSSGRSGADQILAVRRNGTLWAWKNDINPGFDQSAGIPRQVDGGHDWLSAGGNLYQTLAIRRDGTMWSWSRDYETGTDSRRSVQVGTSRDWAVLCCGQQFTVALKKDGTLWGWGWGGNEGDDTYNHTPTQVGSARDWAAVSCGMSFTMALTRDGTLWGMGDNMSGQLGLGNTWSQAAPTQVGGAH